MTTFDRRLNFSWWALRIGLGVGPIITGIDKYIVGAVEILAGLVVLSRWSKIGAQLVGLWLVGIAINLLTTGMFYDLAMRDIEIAIGAFVLSQLSAVREQHSTPAPGGTQTSSSQLV